MKSSFLSSEVAANAASEMAQTVSGGTVQTALSHSRWRNMSTCIEVA